MQQPWKRFVCHRWRHICVPHSLHYAVFGLSSAVHLFHPFLFFFLVCMRVTHMRFARCSLVQLLLDILGRRKDD